MAGEQWAVPCTDATGRPRVMTIRVSHGAVVLGVPAGESAVFAAGQAGLLRGILAFADDCLRVDAARHGHTKATR